MSQYIFRRYEKKYIISAQEAEEIINYLSYNTTPDKYGESDICNIYYDTDDYRIIRRSLEKPVYKEKLRLRCYGTPNDSDKCFLELKKKYKGVVYKRRIKVPYCDGFNYLADIEDNIPDSQIKREIEYFRSIFKGIKPSANIFYKRKAFYDRNDPNVRITFDGYIKSRNYDFDLKNGIYGNSILPEDKIIMEIKTLGAMPLWLSDILTEMQIYPTSFSKYGTAYTKTLTESDSKLIFINGGIKYVR